MESNETSLQKQNPLTADLTNPSLYINRELSQLAFNQRVLRESLNRQHPLLERAKFIAIFASNIDEFFMVRVSGLKQQTALNITKTQADGLTPREQLIAIHRQTVKLFADQMNYWRQIQQELQLEGIVINNYHDLDNGWHHKLRDYFEKEIFSTLTPLASDPSRPFPHISNLSLNLAVVLRDPESDEIQFARLKVPANLPRLIPLDLITPHNGNQQEVVQFIWVDELIKGNLAHLFPGMEIVSAHTFRITRNTDLELQEEEADDLLLTIEDNLRQRHFGQVVRLEMEESMPEEIRAMLIDHLEVHELDVYLVDGPLGLNSLWELMKINRPALKDKPIHPKIPPILKAHEDIFTILRERDVLIHRPYDDFGEIISFLNTVAEDPDVLTIKITLYRVGSNPAVVEALMRARENGKQVTTLVELKARFDEGSNIVWARALEGAGVHVVYGLIGLKTHAKICLVVRREKVGLRRYLHLSTGNYNITTARIYTDLDLLTSDETLCADASELFNVLTGYSKQKSYRDFLVAPATIRPRLLAYIENEAKAGSEGHIIIKCNSLVDPKMIQALYKASQAGVKIDLIIRGICCLRPGIPNISENINVQSIIGRFLEHTRIFYFKNGDNPLIYTGSADLMPRNLDRRVETLFPIKDPILKSEIIDNLLRVQLRDTQQSHQLLDDGSYTSNRTLSEHPNDLFCSQEWLQNERITYQQSSKVTTSNK